jgi:hypothetical protein
MQAIDRVSTIPQNGIILPKGQPIYWWNDNSFNVTKKLVVPKDYQYGLFDTDGYKILSVLNNNNVIINGSNGGLYIGYQNTPNGIDFCQGKAKIDATTGMYKVGNVNLLESGSNTNGNYMKFSDGTLIQWGVVQASANTNYANVNYPINFINDYFNLIATQKYTGGSDYGGSTQIRCITTPQTGTVSAGYIYSVFSDGTSPSFKRNINWIAIGRWK